MKWIVGIDYGIDRSTDMEHLNDDHHLDANMEAQDQEAERRRVNAEAMWEVSPARMLIEWLEGERDDFIVNNLSTADFIKGDVVPNLNKRWHDVNEMIRRMVPPSWTKEIIDDLKEYEEWGGE